MKTIIRKLYKIVKINVKQPGFHGSSWGALQLSSTFFGKRNQSNNFWNPNLVPAVIGFTCLEVYVIREKQVKLEGSTQLKVKLRMVKKTRFLGILPLTNIWSRWWLLVSSGILGVRAPQSISICISLHHFICSFSFQQWFFNQWQIVSHNTPLLFNIAPQKGTTPKRKRFFLGVFLLLLLIFVLAADFLPILNNCLP